MPNTCFITPPWHQPPTSNLPPPDVVSAGAGTVPNSTSGYNQCTNMPGTGRPRGRGRSGASKSSRGGVGTGGKAEASRSGHHQLPASFLGACSIAPERAEEVVEWMTPGTSSGSPQAQSTRLLTTTPYPPSTSCMSSTAIPHKDSKNLDHSAQLFSPAISELDMLGNLPLPEAKPLLPSGSEEVGMDSMQLPMRTSSPAKCPAEHKPKRSRGGEVLYEVVGQDTSGDEPQTDEELADRSWLPSVGEDKNDEGEVGSGRGRVRRVGSRSATANRPSSAPVSRSSQQKSPVWHFFNVLVTDESIAICSLCFQRLSRGKSHTRVGTTTLIRHLEKYHYAQWSEYQRKATSVSTPSSSATSQPRLSTAATAEEKDVQEPLAQDRRLLNMGPSAQFATMSFSTTTSKRQASIPQLLERKKKFSPHHPQAQRLTAELAKLLSLQLLPFNLVDTTAFREFMSIATPQYQVPSRAYFAQRAVPDLYEHVHKNVVMSLDHSVTSKVHVTTDLWSSKHGQGQFISFTAHWVNLLSAGKKATEGSVLEIVVPPRLVRNVSTPSAPSQSLLPSLVSSSFHVRRCHAVLQLVCLRDKPHTGSKLLGAMQAQVKKWLSPVKLAVGKVVCDNSANLLAALHQGKITHVSCLAHVLHLVVQRFLVEYPGLQELLCQVRLVCRHFRRTYPSAAFLTEIQRKFNLPVNRLICDTPSQWNSTLYMLQRFHQQQQAINEFLLQHSTMTSTEELGFFSPRQWLLIEDACNILKPFEQATKMVTQDKACVSDSLPVLFLLEHTLRGIIDKAIEIQQLREEEDEEEMLYREANPPFSYVPGSEIEEINEEEEEELLSEEEQEETGQESHQPTLRLFRGWGKEPIDNLVLSEDEEEDLGSYAAGNLQSMGFCMLRCLRKDPRVRAIKDKDLYWLATLLDPRYKGRMAEFLPPSQRESRMRHYEDTLRSSLCSAYQCGGGLRPSPGDLQPLMQQWSPTLAADLMENFHSFFRPQCPGTPAVGSLRQRLLHQANDYIGSRAAVDTVCTGEPLEYWVSRLDLWPELSQFAIDNLSCPGASVLSERTFSAAGGVVTEKRVRLSHDNVDRLTFIKMNHSWVRKDYGTPATDVCD